MFQVGDRIRVEKGSGKIVTATILKINFHDATYAAQVRREDNGKEDVFVWNIYQDGISVRTAEPEPMVTMTQREFNNRIAEATATGYKEGYADAVKSEYEGIDG